MATKTKKEEKKICTLDNKPAFEHTISASIPVKWTNHATLMMHEEMVTGELGKEKFRFIKCITGGGMRLEYKNQHLDISTRDLVSALMDKIIELQEIQAKQP